MAIPMLGERRELERFANTHRCANCGDQSLLVVRWSAAANSHELWCPRCETTDEESFKRPESLTQMWKRDPGSVPVTVANRMAHKHRKTIESEIEGLPDDLAATIRDKYLG